MAARPQAVKQEPGRHRIQTQVDAAAERAAAAPILSLEETKAYVYAS